MQAPDLAFSWGSIMTVQETVEALNRAWLEERYDELATYFHPFAVVVASNFSARLEGREACIQTYREFGAAATVLEYVPERPQVNHWGSTAVAVCPFFIVYELNNKTYREKGVDLLVLTNEEGSWQIVWRGLSSRELSEGRED